MKKTVSFLLLATALFNSCSKEPKKTQSAFTMLAKVNSTGWNTPCIAATSSFTSSTGSTEYLDITGGDTISYPRIRFSIPFDNAPRTGTYSMQDFQCYAYLDSSSLPSHQKRGLYGKVVISEVSPTAIRGTFSFTCEDSTRITDGSFTCKTP